MKTTVTISQSQSLPDLLGEQLTHFASQHAVDSVYYSELVGTKHLFVVVLLNGNENARALRDQKWIRKAYLNFGITVLLLGADAIRTHQKQGSMFLDHHCVPEKCIYSQQSGTPVIAISKRSKKRSKKFMQKYLKHRTLLVSEIQEAISGDCFVQAFHLYISLYAFHLNYLELLYLGSTYFAEDLNSRLHRLSVYLVPIRKVFIKKSATSFYLIEALYSVKKAEAEGDTTLLSTELLPAIQSSEVQLHQMVENVLRDLKKGKRFEDQRSFPSTTPPGETFERVISILTAKHSIESIYFYHREEVEHQGAKRELLYLLVIAEGIANDHLTHWTDTVLQVTNGAVEIVPVAHRRIWIQEHLYAYQTFFKTVVNEKNKIYQRDDELPELHWEEPYTAIYPGLEYQSGACRQLYQAYRLLRSAEGGQTSEGLGLILSSLVVRSCTCIIYKSMNYKPSYLPVRILWRLSEYGDDRVKKLRYLLDKLSFGFYGFITYHQNCHKSMKFIQESDLELLDGIAEELVECLGEPGGSYYLKLF